jgi:hypothetical protein
MAVNWKKLGIAIGAAIVGSYYGGIYFGPYGQGIMTSAFFVGGTMLGSMMFPTKTKTDMPEVGNYPLQSAGKGGPIPIVYGTVRIAGNVVWLGDLHPYTVEHSSGGGGGGSDFFGGGDEQTSSETRYRRSFLIAICEGTAHIRRAWKGKKEINLSDFTRFSGEDNSGIATLTGEDSTTYKHLCCAYFEEYELGNGQALPNFVFEIANEPAYIPEVVAVPGNKYVTVLSDVYSVVWRTTIDDPSDQLQNGCDMDARGNVITCCEYGVGLNHLEVVMRYFDKNGVDQEIDFPFGTEYGDNLSGVSGSPDRVHFGPYGQYVYLRVPQVGPVERIIKYSITGARGWHIDVSQCGDFAISSNGYLYCCAGSPIEVPPAGGNYYPTIWDSSGELVAEYTDFPSVEGASRTCISEPLGYAYFVFLSGGGANYTVIGLKLSPTVDTDTGLLADDEDNMIGYKGTGGTREICTDHQYVYSIISGKIVKLNGIDLSFVAQSDTIPVVRGNPTALWHKGGGFLGIGTASGWVLLYKTSDLTWFSETNTGVGIELFRTYGIGAAGKVSSGSYGIVRDENPVHIIQDLLTNARYGLGLPESALDLDSFDETWQYCAANELLISVALSTQRPLWDWVDYICSHFGGYRYRSDGKIHLGAFKDEDSVFTLTQDNLVVPQMGTKSVKSAPPVRITKRKYTETFNRVEIQWTDREHNYDAAVAVANDEVDQRVTGQMRKKSLQLSGITNSTYAQKMAFRMLIESMYRHTSYGFTLAYKNMLLEVGDVGVLSDGHLLTNEKMRITSVSEDKDGRGMVIGAVEERTELYPAEFYDTQETQHIPEPTPTLADATIVFREDLDNQLLYLSITPGSQYCNGFDVYRSFDDASYAFSGRATIPGVTAGQANSIGTLLNNLPTYPAVAYRSEDTILVNIGTVTDLDTGITAENFFNGRKILKIDDEIIAYHNCEETAVEGIWKITGLIRGMYNTYPTAHSAGATVATLDITFTYVFEEAVVGQTLYFKALTYYSDIIQDIVDVSSFSYTISGKYLKPLPVSLMRINGREGLITYTTDNVTIDFFYCSKVTGYGRGGYGNALWGNFIFPIGLVNFKIELEEEDGTPITDAMVAVDSDGEPNEYEITSAMRNGKNPVRVKVTPASHLLADETREILITKI